MYILALVVFFLCITFPVVHLINAWFNPERKPRRGRVREQKGMTVIIPCYNEAMILETAIDGLKNLNYTNVEVFYINDGSKDATFNILYDLLDLVPSYREPDETLTYGRVKGFYQSRINPHVFVINKVNGGKADSINAGISYSTKELVVTLDADSILGKDALQIINAVFQDENVVAGGGTVHVIQGRDFLEDPRDVLFKLKSIVRLQVLEYLKGFYVLKSSMSRFNALAIISGAFGVFNRKILLEVEGFRNTIGEDIDITLRFQEYVENNKEAKIMFIPEAECFTECPESWRDLFKQRVRWQKSFMDCLFQFRGMLLRNVFTRPVAFFFIVDAFIFGVVCSFLALYSYVYLIVNPEMIKSPIAISFLVMYVVYTTLYSLVAIIIAKKHGARFPHKLQLCGTILLDLFFFRPISMFFTGYGSVAYFFNKHDWNKVERTGNQYLTKEENLGA